jgi:ABC-type multidrug transport system fused ATPase/permease subunit
MPPQVSIFRFSGSKDDEDVETTGFEMFYILKFHKNKILLGLAFLCSIAGGVMPLVMAFTMGGLLDSMANIGNILESTTKLIKQMALIQGLMVFVMGLSIFLRVTANSPFVTNLRKKLFDQFMVLEIDYFDKTSTGVMISRMSEDVILIRETYIDKGCDVLQNLVQAVGGVVLALINNWLAAMVAIGCIPLIILIFFCGEKVIEKLWDEYSKCSTANTDFAEEVISQFRTVKSFDCEMKESENYSKGLDGIDGIFKKESWAHGVKNGILTFLTTFMIGCLLYFSSYLLTKKNTTGFDLGTIMIMFMASMFTVMGLSTATSYFDDFRKANISAQKLLKIYNRNPEVDRLEGRRLSNVRGRIEFRNVSFKYSTRDEYAMQNLSFIIEAGTTVAFVGESGCGKTTTLQLIQRFYEIESGEILIDDQDYKQFSISSLRSQISAVPQSPVLYSMSIKDNIAFSRTGTDEEVSSASQIGNAHEFIMKLPENYKTIVQQTSLSGGQKQRICISRAIFANTPILLLDEATAALDTESEQLVQQSLETFRKDKTAVIVAHRLATVINADKICVFSNGSIIEEGTHQELLQKNGYYADLVKYQLQ